MPGTVEPQDVLLMILYLALVLAGVYYVTRLVAKAMGARGKAKPFAKRRAIAVVDRVILDKDKSLTVIRYDGKEFLIGASAQSISVLESHEIRHDEAYPDAEGTEMSSKGYASNLFSMVFQKYRQKPGKGSEYADHAEQETKQD